MKEGFGAVVAVGRYIQHRFAYAGIGRGEKHGGCVGLHLSLYPVICKKSLYDVSPCGSFIYADLFHFHSVWVLDN